MIDLIVAHVLANGYLLVRHENCQWCLYIADDLSNAMLFTVC